LRIPLDRRINGEHPIQDRCDRIAELFVETTHWLTGGHRTAGKNEIIDLRSENITEFTTNCPAGDLLHFGLDSVLEIKGANTHSNNYLGIRLSQVNNQLREMENEWRARWHHHFIYSWRGADYIYDPQKKRGVPRYVLTKIDKRAGFDVLRLKKVVAERTKELFVVDSRILLAASSYFGIRPTYRNDPFQPNRYMVRVTRRILKEMCLNPIETLKTLGLENLRRSFLGSNEAVIQPIRVRTDIPIIYKKWTETAHIECLIIYPMACKAFRNKLLRYLNGSVVSIEPNL